MQLKQPKADNTHPIIPSDTQVSALISACLRDTAEWISTSHLKHYLSKNGYSFLETILQPET